MSRQGKNAQFCVSDNGAGISPERLAHIFDGMFPRDREDHADAHQDVYKRQLLRIHKFSAGDHGGGEHGGAESLLRELRILSLIHI